MQKSSQNFRLIFILITMFLNFLGFSIIIPILPFLVGRYVHTVNAIAISVGLMLSAYAFCQFFAAPGLGALSDRFGRRPILLVSLFGSVVGYVFMAIGGSLWMLYLGRIIDGLTGGNISTVFAYVADITKPHERGKYYGMLGAAGGFGFMIGPALGGILATISLTTPLWVAAGITLINLLLGFFVPESLAKEHAIRTISLSHLNPFLQFSHIFSIASLKRLFISGFIFFFAMNALYGNASVYLKDVFTWNPTQIGFLLFVVGIIDIFSQGFLVRKLLPIFKEKNVILAGLILCSWGFSLAAATSAIISPIILYAGIILLNIGDGLVEPSFSSLISAAVDEKMQGRVQGANQGMQSIARVVGPIFAAITYQYWKGLPFSLETILIIVALFALAFSLHLIKNPSHH